MKYSHMNTRLTSDDDKMILRALDPVVEGIAEVFGKNCEVVLHSLEDVSRSVIKIVNGHVTGRKVGSPITDLGVKILEEAASLETDMIGSYYSKLDDGRILKSVTILIRNAQGKQIGHLCINIDLSVPLLDVLREFLPPNDESPGKIIEHYPSTLDDLVNKMLNTVMDRIGQATGITPIEKNRMIVTELYKRGMFKVAGAIDVVAKEMGVSRYTVYNYIRTAKVIDEGET